MYGNCSSLSRKHEVFSQSRPGRIDYTTDLFFYMRGRNLFPKEID